MPFPSERNWLMLSFVTLLASHGAGLRASGAFFYAGAARRAIKAGCRQKPADKFVPEPEGAQLRRRLTRKA